ncbi:META domain-containing protein [Helicobacter didelphidarum]|uniref:META domain-containing protein n=1 Tax=Helicobacter didelphidarum TaxID=2040648 RepID=A0A3D8IRG6_9HELI|nr:META domain-containing protein [Helicobacter didelphidarum]RDU67570.1 META domain-containing protein [Helicobacter didelphidarum]
MKKDCSLRLYFSKLLCATCIASISFILPTAIAQEQIKLQSESNLSRKPINILGNWRINLIEIDGAFVRVPEQAEGAEIQISNNQIAGISGCNRFMSAYTSSINPQQIHIEDGASTRKMCHLSEVMQFESAFLEIFRGSFMIEKNFEGVSLIRDNIKIYLVR